MRVLGDVYPKLEFVEAAEWWRSGKRAKWSKFSSTGTQRTHKKLRAKGPGAHRR